MADDISDKRRRSKKKRSSLLTWKKKFNIKKRFTNKIPVHRRHIRALMSNWSMSDVRSMLTQYEITSMLKQLSIMADKSRPSFPSISQDLGELFRESSCCDLKIICCQLSEDECLSNHHQDTDHKEYKTHKALLLVRWPYFRDIVKSQISRQNRRSFQENLFQTSNSKEETTLPQNNAKTIDLCMQKVNIHGITHEKLSEILGEIYEGKKNGLMHSNSRKLLPLPTTDDSFRLKNSRGKQAIRPTMLECEQQVVTRRNVVRRKHKQRFSMDERILSNQQAMSSSSTRNQQTKSGKFSPSEIMQSVSANQYTRTFNQASNEEKISSRTDKDVPHIIYDDLVKLFADGESGFGDTKIIFSTDLSSGFTPWMTPHARRRDFNNHYQAWISHFESPSFYPYSSRDWQEPLFCHRAILAARSPYFRRLIEKQMSSSNWWETSSSVSTLEIEGNVIPPRYMGTVLYAMYTDKLDLQRIYERGGQRGIPLGGSTSQFFLRDALMLHLIGRFIEFPQLVYGCEEFIIDNLDQNNLLQVLHWTSSPNGSEWVKRQVYIFIRERFSELLSSGVLFELDSSHLIKVLSSDFVNSSELDILKCALRWGEHELLRRIEEREPNLLTHTAHSVSRSKTASARRRELISSRIEELHECTAPLLACVRMQHLLPLNHELFTSAVKRGVISRPPADLLEHINHREGCGRQWIKTRVDFIPPRLFQPYVDETRNILDERFAQDSDCVSLRSVHNFPRDQTWCSVRHQMELAATHGIPDALYMVGQARLPSRRRYGNRDLLLNFPPRNENIPQPTSEPTKYIGKYYPVPDKEILKELFARERELRSTYTVNKVLRACIDCCHSNSKLYGGSVGRTLGRKDITNEDIVDTEDSEYCNRCTAIRFVRLFVVREKDLDDCAIDLLQHPELYYTFEELQSAIIADAPRMNALRPSRLPRALNRLDTLFPPRSSNANDVLNSESNSVTDNHLLNVESAGLQPLPYKESSELKPTMGLTHTGGVDVVRTHPTDKILDRSFSPPPVNPNILHLQQDIPSNSELSSSSSEGEEVFQIRRKRRSLSRKGSSSTTSYQSIPDVAASANSSLQRLRNSVKSRQEGTRSSPLVSMSRNFAPTVSSLQQDDFFAKLTETETCDSSSSSCEENTSENEDSAYGEKLHVTSDFTENEFTIPTSSCQTLQSRSNLNPLFLPGASGTDFNINTNHTQSQNVLQPYVQPRSSTKVRRPRRPLSGGLSDLFNSSLSFIDDNNLGSSEDNLDDILTPKLASDDVTIVHSNQSQQSNSDVTITTQNQPPTLNQPEIQSEMPELVKDGSLPRQTRTSSFEKPDIYPANSERDCNISEQCGQYFFCSLTRDKMIKNSTSNGERPSTSRRGTSFSFALREQRSQTPFRVEKPQEGESSKLNENENILFL